MHVDNHFNGLEELFSAIIKEVNKKRARLLPLKPLNFIILLKRKPSSSRRNSWVPGISLRARTYVVRGP